MKLKHLFYLLVIFIILIVGGYFLFIKGQNLGGQTIIQEGKFKGVRLPKDVNLENLGIRFYTEEGATTFTFKGVVKEIEEKNRSVLLEVRGDELSEEAITIDIPEDTVFGKGKFSYDEPERLKGDKFNLIKEKTLISGGGDRVGDSLIAKVVILFF